MGFVKFTCANGGKPVVISKESIEAFNTRPSDELTKIYTKGGHEFLVKDNYEEVLKILGLDQASFVF